MMQRPNDSNEQLAPNPEFAALDVDDADDDDSSEGAKGELVLIDRPDSDMIVDNADADQVYTISDLDGSSPERLAAEVIQEDDPTGVNIHIDESTEPSPAVSAPPTRTIRFRSRVRITSGLHKHHRHQTEHLRPEQYAASSSQNSLSSSPSSSISVPIRFREDESPSAVSSKWGPLGQRVRLFVSRARQRQREESRDEDTSRSRSGRRTPQLRQQRVVLVWDSNTPGSPPSATPPLSLTNESTPLLDGHLHSRGMRAYSHVSPDHFESESQYQARLNHEIDVAFGKWPRRLLNRHWWWWQLEPIICCRYAEDWDSDY